MFQIEFTPEALADLRLLRKYDQQQIVAAIESQFPHQATEPSRNRKRLRPNQLAEWELRVAQFRVFRMSTWSTRLHRAFRFAGRPYDFEFDFSTDAELVCTELVFKAYEPTAGFRGLALPLVTPNSGRASSSST